jgi:hypothetical protein
MVANAAERVHEHDYMTNLNRRWCRNCNTYQVKNQHGVWADVPGMLGPWPAYDPTQPVCPGEMPKVRT